MIATVTALALVLVLATAHVEAASTWVLWQEVRAYHTEFRNNEHLNKHEWHVTGGYDSREQCERDIPERVEALEADARAKPAVPEFRQVVVPQFTGQMKRGVQLLFFTKGRAAESGPDGGLLFSFVCLPDTIDPRAPKGSGR